MPEETLVAGAVLFRKKNGRTSWLVVKPQEPDSWEIPKGTVRRAESSVRAAIRTIGERVNLEAKVLEEAGRARLKGDPVVYYLMKQEATLPGKPKYAEVLWTPYFAAKQRLGRASERRILTQANKVLREWRKKRD